MTRLEYAQDLINRGLQKEEFISLMDKFDSGEEVLEEEVVDVEKPTGVAEVTADETPQTEAVNTESFLENVSSALQSTEEKELNEVFQYSRQPNMLDSIITESNNVKVN